MKYFSHSYSQWNQGSRIFLFRVATCKQAKYSLRFFSIIKYEIISLIYFDFDLQLAKILWFLTARYWTTFKWTLERCSVSVSAHIALFVYFDLQSTAVIRLCHVWENTKIGNFSCEPSGEHLMHLTCAVFSYITRKMSVCTFPGEMLTTLAQLSTSHWYWFSGLLGFVP